MNTELSSSDLAALPKGHVPPDVYAAAKAACEYAAKLGPNVAPRDMLVTLIAFSIDAGANTTPSIIGAVRSAKGYSTAQIAAALQRECGPNPHRHRWFVNAAGVYELHPNAL